LLARKSNAHPAQCSCRGHVLYPLAAA
jgi:hypothetical protein